MAIVIKEYECEDCGMFEVSIHHNEQCKKCPNCESINIERIISCPIINKVADPRTLGTLMEKNNRKNPLTQEKIMGNQADATKKAQQKKHASDLNRMTPAQKERYINTGQK